MATAKASSPDCREKAWSKKKSYFGFCTGFGMAIGIGTAGEGKLFERAAWGALIGAGVGGLAGWVLSPTCP